MKWLAYTHSWLNRNRRYTSQTFFYKPVQCQPPPSYTPGQLVNMHITISQNVPSGVPCLEGKYSLLDLRHLQTTNSTITHKTRRITGIAAAMAINIGRDSTVEEEEEDGLLPSNPASFGSGFGLDSCSPVTLFGELHILPRLFSAQTDISYDIEESINLRFRFVSFVSCSQSSPAASRGTCTCRRDRVTLRVGMAWTKTTNLSIGCSSDGLATHEIRTSVSTNSNSTCSGETGTPAMELSRIK